MDYKKILENYRNFVASVRSQSNDYDKFCDCGLIDGYHNDDCLTMSFRKDEEYLER